MTTAERKYEIIRKITAVSDEALLKKIEEWLISNIPGVETDEFQLTKAGEDELIRRIKQYEEHPENVKDWNLVMDQVKAKYGL